MVRFAQELDVPAILPAAFYEASRCLLNDGTITTHFLDKDDVLAILRASKLMRKWFSDKFSRLSGPNRSCIIGALAPDTCNCDTDWDRHHYCCTSSTWSPERFLNELLTSADPLAVLKAQTAVVESSVSCGTCKHHLILGMPSLRSQFWAEMPAWFEARESPQL